jgi:hypothetical protein
VPGLPLPLHAAVRGAPCICLQCGVLAPPYPSDGSDAVLEPVNRPWHRVPAALAAPGASVHYFRARVPRWVNPASVQLASVASTEGLGRTSIYLVAWAVSSCVICCCHCCRPAACTLPRVSLTRPRWFEPLRFGLHRQPVRMSLQSHMACAVSRLDRTCRNATVTPILLVGCHAQSDSNWQLDATCHAIPICRWWLGITELCNVTSGSLWAKRSKVCIRCYSFVALVKSVPMAVISLGVVHCSECVAEKAKACTIPVIAWPTACEGARWQVRLPHYVGQADGN